MGTVAHVVKKSCTRESSGCSNSLLDLPAKVVLGELQNTCNIFDFESRDFVACQHMEFTLINVRNMVILFWRIWKDWVVI